MQPRCCHTPPAPPFHWASLLPPPWAQIEFLEVRLAEVMAYADIPPAMRPALSEYDPVAALSGGQGGLLGARWGLDGRGDAKA